MKHVTLGKKWSFTSNPFDKFATAQVYGRNKQDRAFISTKVLPNEEGILKEGSFKVIKTKEKGTILIVPGSDNSKKILLFSDVEGGFRGGCGLLSTTTGNVIAKALTLTESM
jgi:hypothetical protein